MARQVCIPSHVVIPLSMIVKLGKYISGVAFLVYGCQYFALDANSSHDVSAASAQWFSLPRMLGSEVISANEEQQGAFDLDSIVGTANAGAPERRVAGALPASNASAGSSSHGSSASSGSSHSSSGCWGSSQTPHNLPETLAMVLFCFLICSMIDHLNLLIHPGWRFPISVLMFLAGMLVGVIFLYRSEDLHGLGFDDLADGVKDTTFFDPHALLYIVLPPLLYESASSMSWHVLRKILPSAVLLALPGVLLNTLFTGMYVKLAVRMDGLVPSWPTSFLLATILSATDPVAVVASLSSLGAPAKLSSLVEGESLLNDGSAFVLFLVFLDWVAVGEPAKVKLNPYCEGDPNGACVIQFFCHMALGGIAIGIFAGVLLHIWIRYAHLRHDPRLELSIVTVFVYGSFFVAEAMKCSGVLATVVLGMGMAISINKSLSHEARHNHHVLFSQLGYVCNQITFFSAGIISARFMLGDTYCSHTFWSGIRPIAELIGLYVTIHITRGAVVLLFSPFLKRMGYGMSWKEGAVLVFGGLRGAVGLIMGLIVEHNHYVDPQVAQMVAFHTSGIVLLTLFINGQFIDTVYTKLDLYPQNPYRQQHLLKILEKVEAESQKIGIKVIANDWFFSDCLFQKLFQCVPNFGFIEFDGAKLPVPIGIQHVGTALSSLFPYASNFRKSQVARMAREGHDVVSKWSERRSKGDSVFLEMMDSKSEVTSKHDYLLRVKPHVDKLLYNNQTGNAKTGQEGGLYVSGFSLEALKKEDDESFGFEVEICELQGLHLIVGLFADLSQVREVEDEGVQILGITENSIGFDCFNNKIATNGPARDDAIDTKCRRLGKGDVLSVEVTRRPFSEWEIEFGLPNEGIVIQRITLGPFSPCELYPVIEFRPVVSLATSSSKGSVNGSSNSLRIAHLSDKSAALLSSGAGAVGSSLRGIASVVGAGIKGVTGNQKWGSESDEQKSGDGEVGDEPGAHPEVPLPGVQPSSDERQLSTVSGKHRRDLEVNGKVSLSFEMKPASDQDSLIEMFHVFFNMLLNQYTSFHESGTLCDKSLFVLTQCVSEAMDNANHEVNCKSAREFMRDEQSSSEMQQNFSAAKTMNAIGSRFTNQKSRSGSRIGLGIETLYEPVLMEYLVLRRFICKPGFFDRFEGQRLRACGYQNTRAKVEALWAFIEAHNTVIAESPAIERFPQFVDCVARVVKEAVQDLVCLRDVQPFRFFYCKHLLALRMILNRRLKKLNKFIHDGLLSKGDGAGLEEAILERLNEVNLWDPRRVRAGNGEIENERQDSNSDAWQDVDLKPKLKKSLSSLSADDFRAPPIVSRVTKQFSHKSKISEKDDEDETSPTGDSKPFQEPVDVPGAAPGTRSAGAAGESPEFCQLRNFSPEPPAPLAAYNDSIPAASASFNDSIPADGQVDDQPAADQISVPIGEPAPFSFKAVERTPTLPLSAVALPPLAAPARTGTQGWTPESVSPRNSKP